MSKPFVFRDSVNMQYRFSLNLIFKDLQSALKLMDDRLGTIGTIMKRTYGEPYINNDETYFDVCSILSQKLDCLLLISYNKLQDEEYDSFSDDCRNMSKLFHLSEKDVEYYFVVAAVCTACESLFDNEAKELFSKLGKDAQAFFNKILFEVLKLLGPKLTYLCFYKEIETGSTDKVCIKNISDLEVLLPYLPTIQCVTYDGDVPIILTKDGAFSIDTNSNKICKCFGNQQYLSSDVLKICTYYPNNDKIIEEFEFKRFFDKSNQPTIKKNVDVHMEVQAPNSSLDVAFFNTEFVNTCVLFLLI